MAPKLLSSAFFAHTLTPCAALFSVWNISLKMKTYAKYPRSRYIACRNLPWKKPLLLSQAALFQAASCLHSSHRRGKLPSQALFFSHAIILFSRPAIIANRSLIHGSVMVSTVSSTTASLQIESQPKLERREFELERHLMGGCEQMGRLGAVTCQRKLGGINRHWKFRGMWFENRGNRRKRRCLRKRC